MSVTLLWVVGSSLLMGLVSLAGALTLTLRSSVREKWVSLWASLAAGAMLGSAFFHLLPEAVALSKETSRPYSWALGGWVSFLVLELLLHSRRENQEARIHPMGWLSLIADSVHNFLDGIAVSAAFISNTQLGIVTWLSTAAHEVPQELGDFGILLHSGFRPKQALFWNFISSLTFLTGALFTYAISFRWKVDFLIAFAAGNFLYLSCTDLIPEVLRTEKGQRKLVHFAALLFGMGLVRIFHIEPH